MLYDWSLGPRRNEEPSAPVSKLQFYVLRQVAIVLVVVAAGIFAIIWLTKSLSLIDLVMNRGLSWSLFAWITTLLLPASFAVVGPVSLFVAVTVVYHRLSTDSELVIMQNAGISRLQMARPALLVAAAMVAIGYLVSLYLLPLAYRDYRDLKFQVSNNYASVLIQEGVFSEMLPGVTVYVRERGSDGTLMGILVHDNRDPESPVTALAERGALLPGENGPRIVMVRGHRQERRGDRAISRLQFDRYELQFETRSKSGFGRWQSPHEQFLHDLFDPPEAVGGRSRYHQFRMEGHDRLTAPLMSLALPLVALALLLGAEFNRRGHMVRILVAVALVIALEVSMIGFKSLGRRIPELTPLIYVCPLATISVCFLSLWRGPFRRWRRSVFRAAAT